MHSKPVLVTGSTGYVRGRLVPKLLESGYIVRVVGRSLSKMQSRPWAKHPHLQVAQADMLDYQAVLKATKGCWAGFYLVHSMNPRHKDFASADRKAAQNMAQAAERSGLERIIYLGGAGGRGCIIEQIPQVPNRGGQNLSGRGGSLELSSGCHGFGVGQCLF